MKNITIVVATNNAHKLQEMKEILKPYPITLLSMKEAGVLNFEVEENGINYEQNSLIKAKKLAELTHFSVLADDSGLEISFLGNGPGIYTNRFQKEHGGQIKTNNMLCEQAKTAENNKARFYCSLTFINESKEIFNFSGEMQGFIAESPSELNGFGYDPIFVPKGFDVVVSLLEPQIKNSISHRYNALMELVKFLNN